MVSLYFWIKINDISEHGSINLNADCSIREFLSEVKKEHYLSENIFDNIHYVYLKGRELYENCIIRDYADELEHCPIFITDDKTNLIENHIPLIDINNYDNLEFYSNHCLGQLIKAVDKKTKKKVLIRTLIFNYRDVLKVIINHCIPASTLNHCGIAKILGFRYPLNEKEKMKTKHFNIEYIDKFKKKKYVDFTRFIIIYEFVQNGGIAPAVSQYIKSKGAEHDKMNPTIKSKIAYGIASIMKYVHQKGIVHRNLHLESILYDENFEPVINDFEEAIFPDKYDYRYDVERVISDPSYMPPESFMDSDDDRYSFASDVYSYSFILLRLFTNSIKFDSIKQPRSPQQYMMLIGRGIRPARPENIPDSYWELIQLCWKQDPSDRPTFAYIVEELKKDKYAIEEYGMKTNLDELHKYQKRIDLCAITDPSILNKEIAKMQSEYEQQKQQNESPTSLPKEKLKQEICFIDKDDEKFHKVISKIGEGATSVTYKVVDTRTGELMCKKVIKYIENDKLAYKTMQNSIKEFEVLFKINHPCICNAIGINTSEAVNDPNITTEKEITTLAIFLGFEDYSLSECLPKMNNTLKTKIIVEIAHGMNFIHKLGLIHRDLKIENIRLNCIYEAIIIDFGLVRIHEALSKNYSFVQDSLTKGVGTFAYMSPEMLNSEDYDYKTDVYSFGVVLYVMFIGSLPNQSLKDKLTGTKIKLPKPSDSISELCINLISKCLSYSPSERPSFDEILKMIRDNSYNLASFVNSKIVEKRDKELQLIKPTSLF